MPWFGAPGQPDTPRRVPLESLLPHLDRLASVAPRVGVLGTSFGAEAALLLGVRDPRIAWSPHWPRPRWSGRPADLDDRDRPIDDAKWTWRGERVVGVPYVDQTAGGDFPDARTVHEASLAACPDPSAFAIPVEDIAGEVLVSAGGDDRVWQAQRFGEEIVAPAARRRPGHDVRLPPRRRAPGGAAR